MVRKVTQTCLSSVEFELERFLQVGGEHRPEFRRTHLNRDEVSLVKAQPLDFVTWDGNNEAIPASAKLSRDH